MLFNEVALALEILNYALSFKIDGLVSQNLKKDLAQLQKIHDERQEQDKVEPILRNMQPCFWTLENSVRILRKN